MTADKGISFNEARTIKRNNTRKNPQTSQPYSDNNIHTVIPETPDTYSQSQFQHIINTQNSQRAPIPISNGSFMNYSGQANQNNNAARLYSQMLQNKAQNRYENLIDFQQNESQNQNFTQSFTQNHGTQISEYDSIPPGQISRPGRKSPRNILPDNYGVIDLPLLTPTHSQGKSCPQNLLATEDERQFGNNTSIILDDASQTTKRLSDNETTDIAKYFSLQNILKNLPQIISIMIKLIFATELTERIECLTKIGELFNLIV